MHQSLSRCRGLIAAVIATTTLARPALAAPDLTSLADQVLTLVNQQRTARGVKPLARVSPLDRAAQDYAGRMASEGFFGHLAPDGSSPYDRIHSAGYLGFGWGENIAAGLDTADAIMDTWMRSPGHAANILNADFTHIGIGVAVGGTYGIYWVQDFGTPSGPEPGPWTPHLDRLSPNTAAAGDLVTLEGSDFGSPGGVTFGGLPAYVERWETHAAVVRVPPGGRSGPVVVTTAYGSSNGLAFGDSAPPTPSTPPVKDPPAPPPGPPTPPAPSTPPTPPTPSNPPPPTNPPSVPVATPTTPAAPEPPSPSPPPRTPGPTPVPTPSSSPLRFYYLTPRNGASGTVAHILGTGFGADAGRVQIAGASTTVLSWSDTEIVVRIEGPRPGRRGLRLIRADGRPGPLIAFRLTY